MSAGSRVVEVVCYLLVVQAVVGMVVAGVMGNGLLMWTCAALGAANVFNALTVRITRRSRARLAWLAERERQMQDTLRDDWCRW